MNELFISIEYNVREFDGIEEFKSSLAENYHNHIRPKYIPACSEGAEFWMTVFVNTGIADFIKGAVAGGLAWDLIKVGGKKYIFSPLYKALEKLNKDNSKKWGGLKVLKYKLQFDDCEIHIGGVNQNFTSIFSTVFNEVSKRKPEFEKEIGQDVIKIELPIEFMEQYERINEQFSIDIYNEDYSIKAFKNLWKVTFSTDWPILIYSFEYKKLFEPKELAEKLKTSANNV